MYPFTHTCGTHQCILTKGGTHWVSAVIEVAIVVVVVVVVIVVVKVVVAVVVPAI